MAKLQLFQRVRYASEYLHNTAQYTGPDAPTCTGPWARGKIIGSSEHFDHLKEAPPCHVILWDDGESSRVLECNLEAA